MEYRTRDLVEAATLIYFNAQLKNIELNERQGHFVLENVDQKLIDDYWEYKLLVEPYRFNNTVRFLNTSIRALIQKRG